MPPCGSCENGLSEEVAYEYDEFWEVDPDYDYEEETMVTREIIKGDIVVCNTNLYTDLVEGKEYLVDKVASLTSSSSVTPVAYLVGHYRYPLKYFSLKEGGNDVSRSDVINVKENVSSPPQPETKKEFKVGYWYKCVDAGDSVLQNGDYYQVMGKEYFNDTGYLVGLKGHGRTYSNGRFDVNSESSFNPILRINKKIEVQLEGSLLVRNVVGTINVSRQTEEKQTMSNANRRVVNVKLLDNDSGLPVEYALVAQFQGIVTEDSDEVVKQEILLNKNIADAIAKHNEKRVEQTDLEILKRTGNDVKLRQVKLKDLTWIVSAA